MGTEAVRRSLALLGLGLFLLAIFGASLVKKEVPAVQCARLLQATVTSPIESVNGSTRLFPFGITCEYTANGETLSTEKTSWVPAIPLVGGVLLIGGSVVSLVGFPPRIGDEKRETR